MKTSRRVLVSLAVNALLLGFVAWKWRPADRATARTAQDSGIVLGTVASAAGEDARSTPGDPSLADSDFHWSHLDTADWTAYRDGLRRIGCPAGTIRDILEPLIRRHFVARVHVLAQPLSAHFWERMTDHPEDLEALKTAVDALEVEEGALRKELFHGSDEPGGGNRRQSMSDEAKLAFLPPEIRMRVMDLMASNRESIREFLNNDPGGREQREVGLRVLREQIDSDLASVLTAEELEQYRMRTSRFSKLRDLEGVSLTESELLALIRIKERAAAVDPEAKGGRRPAATSTLEQQEAVRSLLGADRAAEFERAQDEGFQNQLRLTDRLGATADQAVQLWEARRDVARRAEAVSRDTTLPEAERQAALTAFREQMASHAEVILGAGRGIETWERAEREWLNQTFRLPDEDPLQDDAP